MCNTTYVEVENEEEFIYDRLRDSGTTVVWVVRSVNSGMMNFWAKYVEQY